MFRFFKILIPALCLFSVTYSQKMIEDSVFTGEILVESNRLKMTNSEAPNRLEVLDKKLLARINGSRLPDALSLSAGIFIKDYGFNSGTKTITLNSTQSEHTLILIDGIRLNSRQNAQYDLSLLDLDNIERIEISNGGSSALYGSEAIGGVVNIITAKGNLKSLSADIKAGLGSYGYRKFSGKFSKNFNLFPDENISFSLSASDERAKNNFNFRAKTLAEPIEMERENSDFNTQNFNLDLSYNNEDELNIYYFAGYTYFERGVPGPFTGYLTGTSRQTDKYFSTGLTLNKTWSDKLIQKQDIVYQYQLQKYFDTATFSLNTQINSYYRTNRVMYSSALSYEPNSYFSLDAGGELYFDMLESNETEKASSKQGALFAVSKFKISLPSSVLLLYPSARYDYFSEISEHNVVTGKFGINFQPFKKTELYIKSTFGNNFSAPTLNELYWKNWGNRELKPERSVSIDAGLLYKLLKPAANEFELSYYNINTKDRIVWIPAGGTIWKPVNIQNVLSEGISVNNKTEFIFSDKFSLNTNINYTYGTALKKNEEYPGDPAYNKKMIYLPEHMAKASFMLNYLTTSKFLKYVSFSLFYNFSSKRYINFENTQSIPGYKIVDGNIGFGLKIMNSDAGFRIIVNNILNEDYSVLNGYPMPKRNYRIELNFKY